MIHKGIKETGLFIEKYVTKKREITLSENTKGTVKLIKIVSGKVIYLTTVAATTIIDQTVKIGSKAVESITGKKSETSKNTSYLYLKEIASASAEATFNILQNLD